MKVALLGAGAREHALTWKLCSSPLLDELWVSPGNAGIFNTSTPQVQPFAFEKFDQLVSFCLSHKIDLVVVGPEAFLEQGVADVLTSAGIRVFGPDRACAQLEASKSFSKDVLRSAGVQTADYRVATSRQECLDAAMNWLNSDGAVVLKASGLAAGKGVFVCDSNSHVEHALGRLYDDNFFGAASEEVVVEQFLHGREVSHFSFVANGHLESLGFAVDFKRRDEGDLGPNTGGMGCYTPVHWLPEDADRQVVEQVIAPVLGELKKRGLNYTGWLYSGLMWGEAGPSVVEFNVRLGDPEAQVLAVADRSDWLERIMALLNNESTSKENVFDPAVCVTMASKGYPDDREFDQSEAMPTAVVGENSTSSVVFAASVDGDGAELKPRTGRVLSVVGTADTLPEARAECYSRVSSVGEHFRSAKYRKDIAERAIEELTESGS